jgi:ribosomal protein S18 acetylase RimI-like enzyme
MVGMQKIKCDGLGELSVRRAVPEDFDAIFAIISDAVGWLHARGLSQWDWFVTDGGRHLIRNRIETMETYLISDSACAIATFNLQWEDEYVWGERGNDGLAGYVHGLAVLRRCAGHNLGAQMLKIAERRILEYGRSILRLDCMAENKELCDYYRQRGFADLGPRHLEKINYTSRCFERMISPTS